MNPILAYLINYFFGYVLMTSCQNVIWQDFSILLELIFLVFVYPFERK
jgi:hypothetical protein